MQLTNVPTSPAVDHIVVEIPQLYDTFSFDGKYSILSKSNVSKTIILNKNPENNVFSNVYNKDKEETAGTILMPSIAENNILELYLTLHYKDNTTRKLATNTDAKIKANKQLKINATLSNTPAQITTKVSYAAWNKETDSADISFPFDDDLNDVIEVDPKAPIGTLIKNGIVFSAGKLVSIDTPSDTLTWESTNSWVNARGANWKIPTIEEWNEIETVLATLNRSLDTIPNSKPFITGHKYWTLSDFIDKPDGKLIHIIKDKFDRYWGKKERKYRVRAIYVTK